ncbi:MULTISPECIES: NCS2 family permease [unclassified Treponema]|uniref:NCS2 family permease n=1 Tax=unclassified Treponema TaxID=2638727 RepID=UPI0005300CC6|nr:MULTISPECIES: NCS2 family permease [unclassified Treponema]AIW88947.1 guanine permease [Treponema sp. OMZ 838]UTC44497.1 NCS2 family permease [Treponema sp. OMZ 857]
MEKLFQLQAHKTNVRTEIIAGLTTFLAMAYILAVNPLILSDAGLNPGSVFTATALSAAVATLMMAVLANLPVALAPGMGLNAFFTYTVVIGMKYSPAMALTAVFLEGLLFILLSFFNVREAIVESIPINLKKAVAAGIGLFITLIGMKNAEIIVDNPATLVGLGNVTSGPALLGIIGLVITAVLYVLHIPGSILLGILITTVIGIPMGVTVPFGGWENWSIVSAPAAPIFWNFDFSNILSFQFFTVFFSFLFVDIFDTVGTLVGVSNRAGLTDKNGNIPRVKQALLSDAVGTVFGAMLGTSTVTSFVESTSGVAAGGRTGLTALTTGVFFLIALVFSPLFLLIPSAATAPALIIVGFLMLSAAAEIDFTDPTEGIPAFLTIVMMPFAYSIAEGIVYGILSYVILKAATGKFKQIPIVTWVLFIIFILRIVLH